MIFRGGDYFARPRHRRRSQHTWSLGIEEQFYLLWPLVLCAVLWRARPGASLGPRLWLVVAVCFAGAVASTAALATTYAVDDPGRAYYGTDTRGAAILIGAGLAALLAARDPQAREAGGAAAPPSTARWGPTVLGGLAAVAVAGLAWAATHVSGGDRGLYGGGMAAVALAVAVVVAHAVLVPSGWSARALAVRPLRVLGLISYGVYLWHWPVFIAANADRTGLEGLSLFAARCGITLTLATLSYVLVERPVQLRVRWRRPALAVTGAGVAVAAGAAVLVSLTAVPPMPAVARDSSVSDVVDRFVAGGEREGGLAGDLGSDTATRSTEPTTSPEARPSPQLHHRRPGRPIVVDVFGDSVAWTLVTYLPSHPELDVRDRTLMGCGSAGPHRSATPGATTPGSCPTAGPGPGPGRAPWLATTRTSR